VTDRRTDVKPIAITCFSIADAAVITRHFTGRSLGNSAYNKVLFFFISFLLYSRFLALINIILVLFTCATTSLLLTVWSSGQTIIKTSSSNNSSRKSGAIPPISLLHHNAIKCTYIKRRCILEPQFKFCLPVQYCIERTQDQTRFHPSLFHVVHQCMKKCNNLSQAQMQFSICAHLQNCFQRFCNIHADITK